MTRKVFIAIPSHDGALRVPTTQSLIETIASGVQNGVTFKVAFWTGDSLLPHARNVLLAQFLASDCDDMVFVDTDISWAPGTLERLLGFPVDFVAGAYRFKSDPENYPCAFPQEENEVNEHGLFEMARVPTGFLRMTRAGLERVTAQCAHLEYRAHTAPDLKCWYLFDIQLRDGAAIGEDFVFCDLIRSLGERIWLDPDMSINHTGSKTYAGHFGAFIQEAQREKMPEELQREHDRKLIAFAKTFAKPEIQKAIEQIIGDAA